MGNPRRGIRETDLPLTLKVTGGHGRFHYSIHRKDSTVAQSSPITYATEALARAEGEKALQHRSETAKPARPPKNPPREGRKVGDAR